MSQEMDSRFYYFQGQTPENTKISDRSHALHITEAGLEKITRHLDRKKIIQEALEKEQRAKAYLKEGSRAIIKEWADSLENMRKKKEEDRIQAIENEKLERAKKFNILRKDQEEMRQKLLDKTNKSIFMNKGNAKDLTSAFILSEVLYEREKQKEFKQFLLQHEAEEYAKEVEDVRRVAREAAEEEKAEKEKAKRKDLEAGKRMRKELEDKVRKEKEEAEKRRIKEIQDYNEAQAEMECIKQRDLEMKLKKKREMAEGMRKLVEEKRQNQILKATEEQELDDVIKAYKTAKERIDCLKKLKEKQLKEETIKRRLELTEKAIVESTEAADAARREIALQNAEKEYEKMAIQKEKEKAELQAQQIRDKLEDRKKFLEKEQYRLYKETELKKWEMVNRYKTKEAIEAFDSKVNEVRKKKTLEYREDLLKQIKENEDRQREEKEIDVAVTKALIKTDDDKLFAYADEILKQQRATGRSTYPTEKAIVAYKKSIRMPLPPNTDVICEPNKPPHEQDAKYILTQSQIESKRKHKCKCLQKN